MPNYQTKAQRKDRYEKLARAEGDQCIVCKIEKGKRTGPPRKKLIIEHADNDKKNWAWGNIHLACYSCNKKMESWPVHAKIQKLQAYADQLERQRQREGLPTRGSVFKEETEYQGASTEIQLNKIYHTSWLKYVISRVKGEGAVEKKILILAAAKKAGCSKQTSTNYLEVETSDAPNSILREMVDDDGNKVIIFRENS
ncbi:MAG: hypothetical protein A2158_01625 [Chloroflexi bacterium RBG_13_46_14]|nr:MAG: hypothetical protein A2158_01625 [Chloroflexi bacterium RBG_13_46_14]